MPGFGQIYNGGGGFGNTSFGGGAGGGLITGGGSFGAGAPADKKKYCMTDLLKALRKQETYPQYPGAGQSGMPKSEDEAQAIKDGNQRVARDTPFRWFLDSGDWLGLGVVGDRGKALGPFQIHEANYKDAIKKWRPWCTGWILDAKFGVKGELCRIAGDPRLPPAPYRTLGEVSEAALNLSICVVLSYLRLYAPEAFARLCSCKGTLADVKKAARIHNGGPRGHTRDSTLEYWKGVQKYL